MKFKNAPTKVGPTYKISKLLGKPPFYLLLIFLIWSYASPSFSAVMTQCYTVPASVGPFITKGQQLRLAALALSVDAWNGAVALTPVTSFSGTAKRCDGTGANNLPAFSSRAYFGQVVGKQKSLRMARVACTGGAGTVQDQFFSIGNAIYHRNCHAGQGIGYITFWGRDDGNSSQCFSSTYPAMFAVANTSPVTAVAMNNLYNNNSNAYSNNTPAGFGLANAMTAIEIAEVARDYLVLPINTLLIQRVTAGQATPAQIIGGFCPAGVPASICQNNSSGPKGLHPLAWGGAQTQMMGPGAGWGTSNGALTTFGQEYEAGLLIEWLGRKVTPSNSCTNSVPYNAGNPQGQAMRNLFSDLFR